MTFSLEGKPSIDLKAFRDHLATKYSKQYVSLIYGYTVKYSYCLEHPQRLSELPASIRANVLKAMVNLSKFLGCYEDYKQKLKNHGIHWANGDSSFNAFLRITNNDHSTLGAWYKEASEVLRPNEKLYLQFTLKSGLRKHESQTAFNKIIELSKEGRLSEYFNSETQTLQHYIYPELSNRKTKRVYISIVDNALISQIAGSQPVSYYAIRKRLSLHKIGKVRIKELRSYFVSYLRQNNILPEIIDLLQGRLDIRNNIQLSHYFKIADMNKLSQQILAVTVSLEESLTN